MGVAYSDPTAKWVPFVLVLFLTAAGWWGALEATEHVDVHTANVISVVTFGLLMVGVFLQGRVFWTGQVDRVTIHNPGQIEVTTMCWVGSGKRITFAPAEATDWKATAKHDNNVKLSSVSFSAKGEALSLSFLAPKVADFNQLSIMNPAFFAKLRADYRV